MYNYRIQKLINLNEKQSTLSRTSGKYIFSEQNYIRETFIKKMWWLSDGLMFVLNLLALVAALLFLFIVARYRTYRVLSVILVANTCCAGLVATDARVSQAISMLFGFCYYSEQCVLTAHFYMVGCSGIYHSLCLQALHRVFSNVKAGDIDNHQYLQSSLLYIILIILQWLISISYLLPVYSQITFIPGSCLCQM
jgi:hypothetical protein